MTQVKQEIHTRVIQIAVNRLLTVLQHELQLNQVEAMFILNEARSHLEKVSGVKIDGVSFQPDKGVNHV